MHDSGGMAEEGPAPAAGRSKFIQIAGEALLSAADDSEAQVAGNLSDYALRDGGTGDVPPLQQEQQDQQRRQQQGRRLPSSGIISDTGTPSCFYLRLLPT